MSKPTFKDLMWFLVFVMLFLISCYIVAEWLL